MIILSFFFRNEWHYGVIQTPPNLKKYIGYDGSFDYQSKYVFDLFLDSTNKRIPVEKKISPEEEHEIRAKYEGDTHYSSRDIDDIIKSKRTKSTYKITKNLFLQVKAIYIEDDGWQYVTVYDEKDVITKKYHNNGNGVECFWFDTVQDVCEFLNSEEYKQMTR